MSCRRLAPRFLPPALGLAAFVAALLLWPRCRAPVWVSQRCRGSTEVCLGGSATQSCPRPSSSSDVWDIFSFLGG